MLSPKLSAPILTVMAFSVHIGWKELEPEASKLEFSWLDRTLEVFHRAHRRYVLGFKPG